MVVLLERLRPDYHWEYDDGRLISGLWQFSINTGTGLALSYDDRRVCLCVSIAVNAGPDPCEVLVGSSNSAVRVSQINAGLHGYNHRVFTIDDDGPIIKGDIWFTGPPQTGQAQIIEVLCPCEAK